MLLDNSDNSKKVHEWITTYTAEGRIDAVTGYFTIGALAFLSDHLNERISRFRFLVGDLIQEQAESERPLDLLNENLTIDAALQLKHSAVRAVEFLRQNNVEIKTMQPNFCHAKAWIYRGQDLPQSYYVTGSSNLTEAELGLKQTNNVELNTLGQGTDADFTELKNWFEEIWQRPEARTKKKVDGRSVNFKQYLVEEIEKVFVQYTPRDLYYKTLFEMFGRPLMEFQNDAEVNRNLGRLEDSVIYQSLYEFQRKGVLSLIKMLQNYGGAILADAVGLGKTWSALAVIKYYQSQGYDVIVLCPKRLDHNWRRFLKRRNSRFERDEFDYVLRYHTDLQDDRLENHEDGLTMDFFQRDRPKLLVIDESHGLRNNKSNRYKHLVENLLRPNDDIKTLLLSATPINNTLNDIRNQFKLLVKDDSHGFRDTLGINNIDALFREATRVFREWSEQESRTISSFLKQLPKAFFHLTDSLVVARTRHLVQGHTDDLVFPHKEAPENIFLEGSIIGKYGSFTDFLDAFPKYFAGYMPAYYLQQPEHISVLEDERQRDFFLAKMMYMLLVKRLESSWASFYTTVEKVHNHHQDALNKVKRYLKNGTSEDVNTTLTDLYDDENEWMPEDMALGKRRIPVADIEAAGNLNRYKKHLETDLRNLRALQESLAFFEKQVTQEDGREAAQKSRDEKLTRLMELIRRKRRSGSNRGNPKVLVFTAYTDTANYLFDQLYKRGFRRLAVVTGTDSRAWDDEHAHKNFEPILERFVPCTKLFTEKLWPTFTPPETAETIVEQYHEWCEWVRDHDPRTADKLNHPIDILIGTDCLSEGQNLQDCDFVVNYDIHWNPVRAIQRMGRIDRLGSINDTVFAANFWPTREVDEYLKLQRRIEDKMTQMRLVGAEVRPDFTERIQEMLDDEHIQQTQEESLMRQMQTSWEDIEQAGQNLGFDHLSLENFRQDLLAELGLDEAAYMEMPRGIYTGFNGDPAACPADGIVALLGYPAQRPGEGYRPYDNYDLIYIDREGRDVLQNPKDVLDMLQAHKECDRSVPKDLDRGDPDELRAWAAALRNWLQGQAQAEVTDDNGDTTKVAGSATMEMIKQMQRGDDTTQHTDSHDRSFDERYKEHNVDLILWFAVTRK